MQTGIAINPDVPVGGFPSYRKNRRIKVIQWERKIFKLYKKIGEDEFLLRRLYYRETHYYYKR